ncbi:MAG: hypothetical protein AAB267_00305 [Candidatus Desantisbacteria bacterium]
MKIVIEPIFEAGFEDNSYGFRPKRSAHEAVKETSKYLNLGGQFQESNEPAKDEEGSVSISITEGRKEDKRDGYKRYPDNYLYSVLGLYRDYRVSWMKTLG